MLLLKKSSFYFLVMYCYSWNAVHITNCISKQHIRCFRKTIEPLKIKYIVFQSNTLPKTQFLLVILIQVVATMWGDQAEWILWREYWFWDYGDLYVQYMKFLLYLIVFSWIEFSIFRTESLIFMRFSVK